MSNQIWAVILFSGVMQGFLLSIALLFNRRGRRLANIILSGMLLSTVLVLLPWALVAAGEFRLSSRLFYLATLACPALAPLVYLYARTLLEPDYTPKIHVVLAIVLLPGLLKLLDAASRGFSPEIMESFAALMHSGAVREIGGRAIFNITTTTLYMGLFLFLTWRVVARAKIRIADGYAGESRRFVIWMQTMVAVLLGLLVTTIILFLELAVTRSYTATHEYACSLMRTVQAQCVSVFALLAPEAFTVALGDLVLRHRKLPFDEKGASVCLERVLAYMKTEKPYRDENLHLADLAERLCIQPHVLSQLINERLEMNFFDFVNRYRVEEAQGILADTESDRYTLIAIGREAGFSSKASFNRAFKKHAGMPPSQYRLSCRSATT